MPFGRKAAAPACLRLFNIDLHHAVIADVKDVLKRLYGNGISITDWSLNLLDGRSMGFPPATKQAPEVSSHDQALNGPMLLNHVSCHSCCILPPSVCATRFLCCVMPRLAAQKPYRMRFHVYVAGYMVQHQ
jgi:hypothetical protein